MKKQIKLLLTLIAVVITLGFTSCRSSEKCAAYGQYDKYQIN